MHLKAGGKRQRSIFIGGVSGQREGGNLPGPF
jgi:hypothetical protein